MNYKEFLETKRPNFIERGFEVNESELNVNLYDFQKYLVKIALKKGTYAIFAECGLGKTIMQLEWANQIVRRFNKSVIIFTPLAVAYQTLDEAAKFGIEARLYVNYNNEPNIYITNYEQIDNIEPENFIGIVLDESSILKNFTGVYKNKLIDYYTKTPYKLCCTATPSPNDVMEIGNHSEFLNIKKRIDLLSEYFFHDGGDTSKWVLKGYAKNEFYSWLNSWSSFIANPSDIGFNGDAFILPELNITDYQIQSEIVPDEQLFNDMTINATDFNRELRKTMQPRIDKVLSLVNGENVIIWVKLNDEAQYLKRMIPESVEVHGSEPTEVKERKLLDFAKGKYKVLITKPKIAQFGMNFQNCHHQIFASLDFSFESLYQSIRRSYRFGQKNQVQIDLITTDTMKNVLTTIQEKEKLFMELRNNVNTAEVYNKMVHTHQNARKYENDKATIINGDSIQECEHLDENSMDFMIYSPPFADLYTYNDKIEDLGNVKNYAEFFKQFQYLGSNLLRILKPGRLMAVHTADIPMLKSKDGVIGFKDFSGDIIRFFNDVGFIYHSRVTIWKNPATEMQRTKALGLLHKQLKKDSSRSRVGNADYLLVFRKDGDNETPIVQDINIDTWQKWASPVWMDINQTRTLNTIEKQEDGEKHICPLQLDVIERAIYLWSNKGETVFTPFAGIGSELYQSILLGRKAVGIELKESYYDAAVTNIKRACSEVDMPKLF